MNTKNLEYDLYLDETGRFQEGIVDPKQREPGKQRGSSQLAGLLVPRTKADIEADKIVLKANNHANRPPKQVIHATEIIKQNRTTYLRVVSSIIKSVEQVPAWQCVRLVNAEQLSYYDRPTTYANLVAETTLRSFEQKLKENPGKRICIRLIDPKYKPGKGQAALSASEYRKRISEYLGFAEVRYGLTREARSWRFDGIVERDYKDTALLQICDVLSHSSADKFERLRTQRGLADSLKGLFGEYDFTLTIRELFERVDDLVKEHSLGMAVMILAESLIPGSHVTKQEQEFAANLNERLDHIIGRLGQMDFRGRDPQLALLVGWLDQLVGQQRLLDRGLEIARWLLEHFEAPLRTHLSRRDDEVTLDWFTYSIRRWVLTACNHKGLLLKAQAEVEAMKSLQRSVATHWERIPLVMDGLIAQAVHYTDCFEFDKASARMRFVADSLKMQQNRFHDLMPQDFPEKLRFDLRARALGTLVQSEIFAGATDPARLQSAREASEEAISEFTSFSDRARQYQYRCHLETVNGDYSAARKYLVWSLERTDKEPREYSHEKIARLISEFSIDPEWKSEFTLLHWLRIGAYTCLDAFAPPNRAAVGGDGDFHAHEPRLTEADIESERDQFLRAVDQSGALRGDACQGRLSEYPVHSILRFVAVISAARGHQDESIRALKQLQALDPIGKGELVLATILLSTHAELAVFGFKEEATISQRGSLDGKLDLYGLQRLIQQIQQGVEPCQARISKLMQKWSDTIEIDGSTGQSLSVRLLSLARANAY